VDKKRFDKKKSYLVDTGKKIADKTIVSEFIIKTKPVYA
jgi:hypothetical protein